MNLKNKRCGDCGAKAYEKSLVKGKWNKPWKDFPAIYLTKGIELWVCGECSAYAVTPLDAKKIDEAIEAAIRSQASQFLEIIHGKSGLTYEVIAHRLGYSNAYISSIKTASKTPAFKLWNQLKAIAIDPKAAMASLDPDFDPIQNNLILRA